MWNADGYYQEWKRIDEIRVVILSKRVYIMYSLWIVTLATRCYNEVSVQAIWLRCASSCKREWKKYTSTHFHTHLDFFPRLYKMTVRHSMKRTIMSVWFSRRELTMMLLLLLLPLLSFVFKQRISNVFKRSEEYEKKAERTQASALWRHFFFGTIKTTYNDERWIDNICVVLEKYYMWTCDDDMTTAARMPCCTLCITLRLCVWLLACVIPNEMRFGFCRVFLSLSSFSFCY